MAMASVLLSVLSGCSSSASDQPGEDSAPTDGAPGEAATTDSRDDAVTDARPEIGDAAADGNDAGDVLPDAGPYAPPTGTSCEYAFFSSYFDRDNGKGHGALRDSTFTFVVEQVKALQSCGAKITLGGMLSLMIYEGGGAKIAFFNDRCAENSYDKSAACWTNPKA
ncbi:MAG: hypothetical protein ABI175_06105, partial [Polyangiales bacterium]